MNPDEEDVTVHVSRVDDFNDRRYRVTVTVTVPADSAREATDIILEAVAGIR